MNLYFVGVRNSLNSSIETVRARKDFYFVRLTHFSWIAFLSTQQPTSQLFFSISALFRSSFFRFFSSFLSVFPPDLCVHSLPSESLHPCLLLPSFFHTFDHLFLHPGFILSFLLQINEYFKRQHWVLAWWFNVALQIRQPGSNPGHIFLMPLGNLLKFPILEISNFLKYKLELIIIPIPLAYSRGIKWINTHMMQTNKLTCI